MTDSAEALVRGASFLWRFPSRLAGRLDRLCRVSSRGRGNSSAQTREPEAPQLLQRLHRQRNESKRVGRAPHRHETAPTRHRANAPALRASIAIPGMLCMRIPSMIQRRRAGAAATTRRRASPLPRSSRSYHRSIDDWTRADTERPATADDLKTVATQSGRQLQSHVAIQPYSILLCSSWRK